MCTDDQAPSAPDPDAVERESLLRHGFDTAAVVGRAAAGTLKGASPVPAARQALLDVDALLAAHLADGEGSLARTLRARLADAPGWLDRHRGDAAAALVSFVESLLEQPSQLAEFVREVDVRWGRDYDERPLFEAAGRPAAPNDPYTVADVRSRLQALLGALRHPA